MSADLIPGEGTTYLPLDSIREGDRVRTDLGNIKELADSIAAVGLLHPVVITGKRQLVAGGRRLAAARSLGWAEVPVRVVDLATAAAALRAESDENTCRKPLTGYEASDMRRRQAEVLAPAAAERKAATQAKIGEGKVGGSPKLGAPKSREVAKTAAIGTGYSGSTLDKVDRIRDVAERGVIRKGKKETPAPAPVVEIAKKALTEIKKPTGRVDRAHRTVSEAIEQYVAEDPEVVRARFRRRFFEAFKQATEILQFEPADVAAALTADEIADIQSHIQTLTNWFERIGTDPARGLRAIQGGKS